MIYKENALDKVISFFQENIKKERVIGLSGNLGAGKTTFLKALLKSLGVKQNVISPTFVLRRDYDKMQDERCKIQDLKMQKIIHIDAYRLENPAQIYQVITKEELADKNNFILIEWPEKADQNIFDKKFLFEHVSETERKISILK